jgi:hypothetical protein
LRFKLATSILLSLAILGCQSTVIGTEKYEYDPNQKIEFTAFKTNFGEPKTPIFEDTFRLEIPTSKPEIKQVEVKPKVVLKVVKPKPQPKPVKVQSGSPKAYALSRVGETQFSCLNKLWERESGWNYKALNKSSGAYGIPQALPGSKMASAGDDWKTNPITQVKWGIKYVNGRYGSSCGAWQFWQSHHWY